MRATIALTAAAVLLAGPGLARGTVGQEGAHDDRMLPATADAVAESTTRCDAARGDDGRGTPYKVDKADNVCGLDEPRALTNPALVDYGALLDATPEAKLIKRRKIDPQSAEGIRLMTEARTRVLEACESVRGDLGHCSVWKKISRRDGTAVDDITAAVTKEIEGDDTPA